MSNLQISLFGNFDIARGTKGMEVKIPPIAQALLAYLLLNRHRTHPRTTLLGVFWGEHTEERARHCLNSTLWRLRSALESNGIPKGTYINTMPGGEIGFNTEGDYWLDIAAFESKAQSLVPQPIEQITPNHIARLATAVQLYTGDLLDGYYDDWVLRERERLRNLYLTCLERLMMVYKHHQDFGKSIIYGQQILQADPLRENIHRHIMRLYIASGQRALAARQYEICRHVLARELQLSPMPETQALYAQVARHADPPPASATNQTPDTRQELKTVKQNLDHALIQLQQAIQIVAQLTAQSESPGK